uniref:Secreted protein n=1 Tax=Plectus sambesii TaxID=2011161 RepID=A0A914WWK1_9BILA
MTDGASRRTLSVVLPVVGVTTALNRTAVGRRSCEWLLLLSQDSAQWDRSEAVDDRSSSVDARSMRPLPLRDLPHRRHHRRPHRILAAPTATSSAPIRNPPYPFFS